MEVSEDCREESMPWFGEQVAGRDQSEEVLLETTLRLQVRRCPTRPQSCKSLCRDSYEVELPSSYRESDEVCCSLVVEYSGEFDKRFLIRVGDCDKKFHLAHTMFLQCNDNDTSGENCATADIDENQWICVYSRHEQMVLIFNNGQGKLFKKWKSSLSNALACLLLCDACINRAYRNPNGVSVISLNNLEHAIGRALHFFVDDTNKNLSYGLEVAECKWLLKMALKKKDMKKNIPELKKLLMKVESFTILQKDRDFLEVKGMLSTENMDTKNVENDPCLDNISSLEPYSRNIDWEVYDPMSMKNFSENSRHGQRNGIEEEKKCSEKLLPALSHIDSGHSQKPVPYVFPRKSEYIQSSSVSLKEHYSPSKLGHHVYHSTKTSALVRSLSGDEAIASATDICSTSDEFKQRFLEEKSPLDDMTLEKIMTPQSLCNNSATSILSPQNEADRLPALERSKILDLSCSYDDDDDDINGDESFSQENRDDDLSLIDSLPSNVLESLEVNSVSSFEVEKKERAHSATKNSDSIEESYISKSSEVHEGPLVDLKDVDIIESRSPSASTVSQNSSSESALVESKISPSDIDIAETNIRFSPLSDDQREEKSCNHDNPVEELNMPESAKSPPSFLNDEKYNFTTPPRPGSSQAIEEKMNNTLSTSSSPTSDSDIEASHDILSSKSPALTSAQSKRLREIMNNISKGSGSVSKREPSRRRGKPSIQAVRYRDTDQDLQAPKSEKKSIPTKSNNILNFGKSKLTPQSVRDTWGIPCLNIKGMNGENIEINSDSPVDIETEYFKGVILIMLNTTGKHEKFNKYRSHFAGKQRKFEIQIQGQMKTLPDGEIMIGGELPQPLVLSFFTKTFLSVLTTFAAKINPSAHFSFGSKQEPSMMHELPHLMFPLMKVMDRVVITAPGEDIPALGKEIYESNADQKTRKSSTSKFSFQLGYTYTLSIYSMYVNFPTWEVCGIPGFGPKSLGDFIGKQNPFLVCYEIAEKKLMESGQAVHKHAYKNYLLRMEMKHESNLTPEDLAEANKLVEVETEIPKEQEENVTENINVNITDIEVKQSDTSTPMRSNAPESTPTPLQMKQAELLLMGEKQKEKYKKRLKEENNQVKDVVEETCTNVLEEEKNQHAKVMRLTPLHSTLNSIMVGMIAVLSLCLIFSLSMSISNIDNGDDNAPCIENSAFFRLQWQHITIDPLNNIPRHVQLGFEEGLRVVWKQQRELHYELLRVVILEEDIVFDGSPLRPSIIVTTFIANLRDKYYSLKNSDFGQTIWVLHDDIAQKISQMYQRIGRMASLDSGEMSVHLVAKSIETSKSQIYSPTVASDIISENELGNHIKSVLTKYSGQAIDHVGEVTQQVLHGTGEPLRIDEEQQSKSSSLNYDKNKYVGESQERNRHGRGVYTWYVGRVYDGEWFNNKMHGKGSYEWENNYRYVGDWVDGHRSGMGFQEFADGMKYEGEYLMDQRSGNGVYIWPSGESYSGGWLQDKMHGRGVYTSTDGKTYECEYDNGVLIGHGENSLPTDGAIGKDSIILHPSSRPSALSGNQQVIGDQIQQILSKYSGAVADQVGETAHQILHGTGEPLLIDEKDE